MSKDNYPLNTEPMQFRQDKAGPVGGAGELTPNAVLKLIYGKISSRGVYDQNNLIDIALLGWIRDTVDSALAAAKAPQGVDSQTICRKLDAVAQHLNLKGRPQSLDIATAVRLVEEAAEWAAKHIEERGRELDKLRATLNKVAKDIDGTSPNGESIARERIQSVLREAAALAAKAPQGVPANDYRCQHCAVADQLQCVLDNGHQGDCMFAEWPYRAPKPAPAAFATSVGTGVIPSYSDPAIVVQDGVPTYTPRVVNQVERAGPAPGAERLREAAAPKPAPAATEERALATARGDFSEWPASFRPMAQMERVYICGLCEQPWDKNHKCVPTPAPGAERLRERITEYLAHGGLFNPESVEHAKVRELLIDAREALAAAPPAPEGPTLEEEQAAHEKIASLCFAAGAESPDGTSVGAVKDLIRRGHASAERVRELVAKWRKQAANISELIPVSVEVQSMGKSCAEHADELERALPPSTGEKPQ